MIERSVLAEMWRGLVDWYLRECRYWRGLLGLAHDIDDLRGRLGLLDEAHGIWGRVWHEHDLVMAFSCRLMEQLRSRGLNLHPHVSYELRPANFGFFMDFSRRLSEAVRLLRSRLGLGRRWYPEIDLIIAADEPPFEYCLEFKYYHYLPTTWDVVEDLRRKITILETLKNCGVCADAGVLLLDDALCRRNHQKCRELKAVLKEAANDLLVLCHHITYDELLSSVENFQRSQHSYRCDP